MSTVGARLTLPASTAEEAVRGSGRQVRILRAPSIEVLQEIVTRELRAFSMSFIGENKGARRRKNGESAITNAAIAATVLAALEAGDFRGAIVAHATGFGLGVELPIQLGGDIGDSFQLPAPGRRRGRAAQPGIIVPDLDVAEDDAELDVELPVDGIAAVDPSVRQAA